MKQAYCIYLDQMVDSLSMTPEHIIPFALGGSNLFTIDVSGAMNSKIGSTIDGQFCNDPIVKLIRTSKGFKGHSNKSPHAVFKKAIIKQTGDPVQLAFKGSGLQVFSLKERKYLSTQGVRGKTVRSIVDYSRTIRMVFTAKVLLAAGYFIYGDTFVKYGVHKSLRTLMNYKQGESFDVLNDLPLKVTCQLSQKEKNNVSNLICELLTDSCVVFILQDNSIHGYVGIGGVFIGSITFNAEVDKFPSSGEYENGHIVQINKKGRLTMSYKKILEILVNAGAILE